ncbi:DNRLRE domain-containing protein [Paenibacillus sp. J5C_2022]|uniref:CBM96 family carbohydrate-binding protein n=1 Tax=Paenibacillus sp. J5C2022 TaxID=2977129 RepID=UPI0021D061F8|nr:polysaccharide lyase family 8 super-sandwich domain-containing protein [Paenibacillus sp. J5C2022]MCU6712122.1 DNRLRE domain-containing protein [Paenibacillus sp. J5C2022]
MTNVQKKGIIFILIFSLLIMIAPKAAEADAVEEVTEAEFAQLRAKWKEYLTGGSLDSSLLSDPHVNNLILTTVNNAQLFWDTMDTTPTRTRLWNEDGFFETNDNKSGYISQSFGRLRVMAEAYVMEDSSLYGNSELKDAIVSAMNWIYSNWYNESIIPDPPSYDDHDTETWTVGNWYDWQIGSPLVINDIIILMYDDFTRTLRDDYMAAILHYNPDLEYGGGGGYTEMLGGNLAWKALVFTLMGAIQGKSDPDALNGTDPLVEAKEHVDEARAKVMEVFRYRTEPPNEAQRIGDSGFYEDGSFIGHYAHSYLGGYGLALLRNLSPLMDLFRDTRWEIKYEAPETNPDHLYSFIYDAYEPLMYKGALMDMTRGRGITSFRNTDRSTGIAIARAILDVAQHAPAADQARLKAMVKQWIEDDTEGRIFDGANIQSIKNLNELIADTAIAARGELVEHKTFYRTDQVVHRRPGYALGLSMYSTRIQNFESFNKENKQGWYINAGATYLYNDDLGHYSNQYWPTVNSYRIPGTTVDTKTLLVDTKGNGRNHDKASTASWVGGASLPSNYGVAGMEVADVQEPSLRAKKSWFMFDDEVVALGSDIVSADQANTIETIVENRQIKQDGSNVLLVNGNDASSATVTGSVYEASNADWIHLEGNVSGADIGYYFPDSPTVKVLREERSASWEAVSEYSKQISLAVRAPIADAYIQGGGYADTNFGEDSVLRAKDSLTDEYTRKSYLKFDISDIKSVKEDGGSTLRIYGHNSESTNSVTVNVYGVTDNGWTEEGITWNNAPAAQSTALDSVYINEHWKYYEWDVSEFVTDQLDNGAQSVTFMIEGANDEANTFYAFSGEREFNKPQLRLDIPEYKRQYMNIWFDHGIMPDHQSYAYVLLPNQSSEDVASYADNPDIEIISNDTNVHAVKENSLHITAINFWENNNSEVAGVRSNNKASFIMQEDPGVELDIAVSDPTQENTGTIEISLDKKAQSVISKDAEITVTQLTPFIKLSVDVNGSFGKTFHIQFSNPEDSTLAPSIQPVKDAYVQDGGYASTNFGTGGLLRVKDAVAAGYTRKSYLQFDVSSLSSVSKAQLLVYGRNSESTSTIGIKAYGVADDTWSEDTITWNNSPAASAQELDTANVNDTWKYYVWDITSYVQQELAGDGVVSIMLAGTDDENQAFYGYSKETTNTPPLLVIEE